MLKNVNIVANTPASGWIQTFTGRQFWPLDPRPEDVDILDIAHALSMKCRYSGHCRRFYSVAEHSVLVSRIVPEAHAKAGLLHDAAEAYLPDVPRPVKPRLAGFKEVERKVEAAIAEALDVAWPWSDQVHVADTRILADEKEQLMARPPAPWDLPFSPAGVTIEGWDPEQAKWQFMRRWIEVSR